MLFYKPVTSLIGPNAPVIIPAAACPPKDNLSDYEVELVIVIGKTCKDVKAADALDYVLAYSGSFAIVSHAFDSAADFPPFLPVPFRRQRRVIPQASIGGLAMGLLEELWLVFLGLKYLGSASSCDE